MRVSDSTYDLVIRGGTIVDGSGSAPFVGDVAVRGGWIVATGSVPGRGAQEIQAEGLLALSTFTPIMMGS
jgi:N-acyl-D-amino-acid deacylase